MNPPTPSAKFQEDVVDGFSLGNGTVDNLAVNVIVDHDALRGSVLFIGVRDIEQFPPSKKAKDMSGDFQHVSIHTTPTSILHSNVSLIVGIANGCFWWRMAAERNGRRHKKGESRLNSSQPQPHPCG
jgi:hypothetical protein